MAQREFPLPPASSPLLFDNNAIGNRSRQDDIITHATEMTSRMQTTPDVNTSTLISRRKTGIATETEATQILQNWDEHQKLQYYGGDNVQHHAHTKAIKNANKEPSFTVTFTTSVHSLYYKELAVLVALMLFAVMPVLPSAIAPMCGLTFVLMYFAHTLHYRRTVIFLFVTMPMMINILLLASYFLYTSPTIHSFMQLIYLTLINTMCSLLGLIHFRWVQTSFPAFTCIAERLLMGVTPIIAIPSALTLIYTYSEVRRAPLFIVLVMCAEFYFFYKSLKSSFLHIQLDEEMLTEQLATQSNVQTHNGKTRSLLEQPPEKLKETVPFNSVMFVQLNSLVEILCFASLALLLPLILYTLVVNHWFDHAIANLFNSVALVFIFVNCVCWRPEALMWAFSSLERIVFEFLGAHEHTNVLSVLEDKWMYKDMSKRENHIHVFGSVMGEWFVIGTLFVMQPYVAYRVLHCHYAYLLDTVPFPWNYLLLLVVLYSIMFVGLLMYTEYRIKHKHHSNELQEVNSIVNKILYKIIILPFVFGPLALCVLLNVEVFFFLLLIAMTTRLIPPDYLESSELDPNLRYMLIFVMLILVMMWIVYLSGNIEETLPVLFGLFRISTTTLNRCVLSSYILLLTCTHFYWMAAYKAFKVTLTIQLLLLVAVEHVLYSQHRSVIYSGVFVWLSSCAGLALAYYLFSNTHISKYFIALIASVMVAKIYAYYAEITMMQDQYIDASNAFRMNNVNRNVNGAWGLMNANNLKNSTLEHNRVRQKVQTNLIQTFNFLLEHERPKKSKRLPLLSANINPELLQSMPNFYPDNDMVVQTIEPTIMEVVYSTWDEYGNVITLIAGSVSVACMVYIAVLAEMELYAKVNLANIKQYSNWYLLASLLFAICSTCSVSRAMYEFVTQQRLWSLDELVHVMPGLIGVTMASVALPFFQRMATRYLFARGRVDVLKAIGIVGLLLMWVQPTIHNGTLQLGASQSGNVEDNPLIDSTSVLHVFMNAVQEHVHWTQYHGIALSAELMEYCTLLFTNFGNKLDVFLENKETVLVAQLFALILAITFGTVQYCRTQRLCRWICELLLTYIMTLTCMSTLVASPSPPQWNSNNKISTNSSTLLFIVMFCFVLSYIFTLEITHYQVTWIRYSVGLWLVSVLCMIVCLVLLPRVASIQSLLNQENNNENALLFEEQIKNAQLYGKVNTINGLAMLNTTSISSLMQIHVRVKFLSTIAALYLFQAFLLRWRVSSTTVTSLLPDSVELNSHRSSLTVAFITNASTLLFVSLTYTIHFCDYTKWEFNNTHSCVLYILVAPLLLLLVNDQILFRHLHVCNSRYLPPAAMTMCVLWLCAVTQVWHVSRSKNSIYTKTSPNAVRSSSFTLFATFILYAVLLLPSQLSLLCYLWRTKEQTHGRSHNESRKMHNQNHDNSRSNDYNNDNSSKWYTSNHFQWLGCNILLVLLLLLPSSSLPHLITIKWSAFATLSCQLARLFSNELKRVKTYVEHDDDYVTFQEIQTSFKEKINNVVNKL